MTKVKISKNCFHCVIKHDNFTLCQKNLSKKVYYFPDNYFLFEVSGFLKSNVKFYQERISWSVQNCPSQTVFSLSSSNSNSWNSSDLLNIECCSWLMSLVSNYVSIFSS